MTRKIKNRNHNAHEYGKVERDYYATLAEKQRADEARKRETLRLYRRVFADTSKRGGVRQEGASVVVTDPIDLVERRINLEEWNGAAISFKKNG